MSQRRATHSEEFSEIVHLIDATSKYRKKSVALPSQSKKKVEFTLLSEQQETFFKNEKFLGGTDAFPERPGCMMFLE
ncbi:hypothetical protein IT401_01625 [Candidatus Nomurabacteria bacterium]|nr:hypothetical protein [Candidatus Nomurabacteria bacterium]